jgi:hypothetical protein
MPGPRARAPRRLAAMVVASILACAGGAAQAAGTAWSTSVHLAGAVWRFPSPVTGLGYAGTDRLWVFLSQRAVVHPDALWEVDAGTHRVLLRVGFPGAVAAYGTAPDGAAFVAEGERLQEWWQGRQLVYRLPTGTEAEALAPVTHDAVWLALRLGATGRVEVGLYRLPSEVFAYAHHVPGMADESVASLAAAPGGAWLASAPRPVLYWTPAVGGPSTSTRLYATAFFPPHAQTLSAVAVGPAGSGWVSGYTTSGQPAVWPLRGVGRIGDPIPLPGVVNMVSAGLALAPTGTAYVGFSAVGGSSGYPGVAGVSPAGDTTATVWPDVANPGGGIGPLLIAGPGRIWAAMPFSDAVLPLSAS